MKGMVLKLGVTAAMLLSFLSSLAYDFEVDGIYYDVVSFTDFTCEVVKGDVDYTGDVVIPSEVVYNGRTLTVTEIGRSAFYDCTSLTSVTIGDSVTEIEEDAFYDCKSLTSVTIGDSVTIIGGSAFQFCTSLTSITIPDSVTEIGGSAFQGCTSLTSITIPDSVTEIRSYAFQGCESLTSVEIPNSVTEIGYRAFQGCESLTSITIPDSVTEIGENVFMGCSSLISVSFPNSISEINKAMFCGCTSLTSFTIPNSVGVIRERAFSGCSSLENIELNNVVSIRSEAFTGCSSLKSITFPSRLIEIISNFDHSERYIFSGCNNLKEAKFEYRNTPLEIIVHAPYSHVQIYSFLAYTIFKNGQDSILPIETLYLDREFPREEYKIIPDDPYLEVPTLRDLTLGRHIKEVQIKDLNNMTSLECITCLSKNPPKCESFSNEQYMNVMVKVPFDYLEAYQQAEPWKNFWNLQGFYPAGVNDVNADSTPIETGRYDLNGRPISDSYEGIAIIRYSDGSTKKEVVRK